MAHDETIRIYRSNVPGAEPPSLTYGELAANLADRKVFVGGPGGTADMIVLLETPEATGLPLATTGASGVASFFGGDFTVSTTGHVFLSRDFIDIYSGDGIDVIGGGGKVLLGESITIRNVGVTSFNGATGSISLFDFVQGEGIVTRSQGNKIILTNIGVTGISAGHTGISLNGTTGSLQIFNMGVLSVDGQTGHIDLGSIIGETGDTVLAGLAIGVARNNNQVTINNLGVTSFNGQTGGVQYSPPIATHSVTGVAFFPPADFQISNGSVSLTGNVARTTVQNTFSPTQILLGGLVSSAGITSTGAIVTTSASGFSGASISTTTVIHPVGGLTIKPPGTPIGTGAIKLYGSSDLGVVSYATIDSGAISDNRTISLPDASGTIALTNSVVTSFNGTVGAATLTGDGGAIRGAGNNAITARLADTSVTGVAFFDSAHFTVDTGRVSLKTAYTITGNTVLAGSGIAIPPSADNTKTIVNIGVTGISAGHTGIALSGTTGNVQIFNMGVLSVNGYTGHVNLDEILIEGATGDTVLAGSGIAIPASGDNTKTIINVGVTGILQDDRTLTGAVRFNSGKGITFSYGSGGLTFANTGVLTINSATPDESGNFDIQAATVVTGDGGALVGDGVRILARLATSSLTGVASFPTADFGVVNGSVSLTGNVARTNVEQTFNAFQNFTSGLSGNITGNATTATTAANANALGGTNSSEWALRSWVTSGLDSKANADGSNASGTWGIDIDGNATTATTANKVQNSLFFGFGLTSSGSYDGSSARTIEVSYRPPLATTGASGVASFLSRDFSVSNTGHVSLSNNFIEINSGNGISIFPQGRVDLGQAVTVRNIGVTSFNGSTGSISLINFVQGEGIATIAAGNKVTFANIGVTAFNGQTGFVVYHPPIASEGASGVASFDDSNFRVTSTGHVYIKTGGIGKTELEDSGITINTNPGSGLVGGGTVDLGSSLTLTNIGVTGISAGHTGIALNGTTGNVQIFNMGVLSLDGQTGHLSRGATGDTISAGLAIGVSVVSGNNKRIDNLGVTSFNGLTGAVTLTGDGGAVIGRGNNTITARIATSGATGVASFPPTFFAVNNGAVSLSGPYGVIGVTGIAISDMDGGITGRVVITGGTNVSITKEGNRITISSNDGATGNTVLAGSGIAIPTSVDNTKTIINVGVTGIGFGANDAGLTGKINLTAGTSITLDYNSTTKTITINSTGVVGATGDTVVAGVGTSVVRNGNQVTVNNMGVTSFNGATGAVSLTGDGGAIIGASNNTIRARLATESLTGVASFPASFFSVSNGAVSLSGPYGIIGVTGVTAGTGISLSGITGNVRINNMGVTSFNGATGTVVYAPPLATTGASGVASFDSGDFAVSSTGHVTIKALGVGNAQLENSTFRVYTLDGSGLAGGAQVALGGDITLTNIGVTGISAGHTGIALSGITGNVRIFNMGVHTFNGSTGHITFNPVTGDTVVAGVGISVVRSNNQVTVNNMGVTSFNGLTGSVTLTGDGGALVGVGNNTITARLATSSLTGIASFPPSFFSVSNGAVSLSGPYGIIGVTGIGFGNDIGLTGKINLTAGTNISLVLNPTTKTVTINSTAVSGVSSLNTYTGDVTISLAGDGGAIQTYSPLSADNIPFGIRARLATVGVTGVASFDSSIFTVSTTGHVSLLSGLSLFTIRDEVGGSDSVNRLDTLTITGGQGIDFLRTSKNNYAIRGVTATTGVPGVASFLSNHFAVSSTGHVSLASAYTATGDTVTAGLAIGVSVVSGNNKRIDNLGVTSFNGLTGAVTLTGDGGALSGVGNNRIAVRNTKAGETGVASFNTTHFSVSSSTGHVSLASAYTITGDTVRGDNSAITVGNPSGRLKDVTVRVALVSADPIEAGKTGVAAFFQDHFTVNNGLVKLYGSGGGGGPGPLGLANSGIGLSTGSDNSASFIYLDIGNLTEASADRYETTDELIMRDSGSTSLIKTRRVSIKSFFLNDGIADLFSTTTPGQMAKTKDANSIQYSIVTSNIGAGQEGLVKGATAFAYIAQNTVKSINGQTGDIGCIAVTCAAQTFTGLQTFATGISAANLWVSGGATFGTVTATTFNGVLNGNASTATTASNANSLGGTAANSWALQSWVTSGLNGKANTSGNNATGTWPISITGNAATSTTASNSNSLGGTAANSWALQTWVTSGLNTKANTTGNNATGTWPINITGNAGSATTATTATNSTQLGGTGADLWALQSWVTSGLNTKANTTGNNASGTWPISITGNAATATTATTASQVSNALTIGSGLAGTSSTYNGSAAVTISNVGVTSLNGLTGARTLTGDGGAIVGVGNDTIRARLATASLTGVASFPATDFGVSTTGVVSLTGNVARTNITNSFTALQRFNASLSAADSIFVGRGVTSVEIAFRDISGDIFNPVPSTIIKTNDSKGLYLLHTTGTGSSLLLNSNGVFVGHNGESVGGVRRATLSIGSAVVEGLVSLSSYRSRVVFNNYSTIDGNYSTTINRSSVSNSTNEIELPHQDGVLALTRNLVSSFNGLTGEVTLTGDGGAIVGVGNNAIRARLATASLTGVASFPATDFAVSAAGAVTLTGNVAKTNVTQTFTGLQTISGGLSAGGGVTFSSPIASPGYRYTSSAFETKTAGFTLAAADNGKVFVMNNSTTAVVTVPTGLPVGFACEFLVTNARVDIEGGAGVQMVQYSVRNYQYTRAQLISYEADKFFHSISWAGV